MTSASAGSASWPATITLEAWGGPADAYLGMGFAITKECGGWERILRT